ncbi:hypothetical protein HPB52_009249 [Rhipicephalus sanguineus]|uniref:Uncharacterized protein n=1 Tax=Rhipicephalus sanguineus TaxID=34632 RepID=A0A9D4SSH5_RHISA|nr:hypothetical protein HPB52_009249 [Rhipicephalus sanguineus]
MPHEAMVEGEQISKEEAESNGWITAHRKRNADKTRLENGDAHGRAQWSPRWRQKRRPAEKGCRSPPGYRACPNHTFEWSSARGEGWTCVVRGIDADLPEAALQSLFVTPKNPMVLGVRRIKESTTVIVLFNGMKVPNYVRCGPQHGTLHAVQEANSNLPQLRPESATGKTCAPDRPKKLVTYDAVEDGKAARRRTQRATQPTLEVWESPLPPKRQLRRLPGTPPRKRSRSRSKSRSRVRINSQPTWADKAAKTGETRAPAQQQPLPQQTLDKIQSLERENASLRKELSEIKSLLQEMQQRERASGGQATAAAASLNRGAKRRAGPEPMDDDDAHVSDISELLDKLRTDIISEISPIKLQLAEHTTRLQILESDRQRALLGTPPPRQ